MQSLSPSSSSLLQAAYIVVRFRRATSERKSIIKGIIIFPSLADRQRGPVSSIKIFHTKAAKRFYNVRAA